MKTEYYKSKILKLTKGKFHKVNQLLNQAAADPEISLDDINALNNIADDIYYERIHRPQPKNEVR